MITDFGIPGKNLMGGFFCLIGCFQGFLRLVSHLGGFPWGCVVGWKHLEHPGKHPMKHPGKKEEDGMALELVSMCQLERVEGRAECQILSF